MRSSQRWCYSWNADCHADSPLNAVSSETGSGGVVSCVSTRRLKPFDLDPSKVDAVINGRPLPDTRCGRLRPLWIDLRPRAHLLSPVGVQSPHPQNDLTVLEGRLCPLRDTHFLRFSLRSARPVGVWLLTALLAHLRPPIESAFPSKKDSLDEGLPLSEPHPRNASHQPSFFGRLGAWFHGNFTQHPGIRVPGPGEIYARSADFRNNCTPPKSLS